MCCDIVVSSNRSPNQFAGSKKQKLSTFHRQHQALPALFNNDTKGIKVLHNKFHIDHKQNMYIQ